MFAEQTGWRTHLWMSSSEKVINGKIAVKVSAYLFLLKIKEYDTRFLFLNLASWCGGLMQLLFLW